MCNPTLFLAGMQAGGSIMQGYSAQQTGRAQQMVYEAQAASEQDVARAEGERIQKLTRRARGAARAALAGAGVAVDSATALDIDEDITQRGQQDYYMALLSGDRKARELKYRGQNARSAGNQVLAESVLQAGAQAGTSYYRRRTMPNIVGYDRETGAGIDAKGQRIF